MPLGRIAVRGGAALAAAALIVGFGARWWFFVDRALPAAATVVIVPSGATGGEIAGLLASRGIVRNGPAFLALARFRREQDAMRAGQYRLAPHQSAAEVLDQLVQGGSQVARWITIPEGFTARQIAERLGSQGIGPVDEFERYFLTTSIELDGTRTVNLEGFLFPDTYLMPIGGSPPAVAERMTDKFRTELPPDAAARAKQLGLTVPQVVTVASLIEREAKADDERRLMAGVYYNRLRLKMPLQVDATIEYAFAHHHAVITASDLHRDSPYNSYEHLGLPPTPIANPGRASLLAAFDPEPSAYLYYVYKGNGHHAFARTLAEHNANVARYLDPGTGSPGPPMPSP
ncbi:MAG: endolytic transglycosylase MltG [Vulcanimicrobiaceae bacterium]